MKNFNDLLNLLPLLIPVVVIQLSLQVYCIIDLVRRKKVRYNNKLLWGVIIVALSLIGPVVYLVLRGDED